MKMRTQTYGVEVKSNERGLIMFPPRKERRVEPDAPERSIKQRQQLMAYYVATRIEWAKARPDTPVPSLHDLARTPSPCFWAKPKQSQ